MRVYTGKVEVGQNVRTSLSQGVAEELRLPVEQIDLVMGDTQLTPFDMGTFGSRTTPTMNLQLRKVAASARDLLIDLAAARWQTDRRHLVAADGKVMDSDYSHAPILVTEQPCGGWYGAGYVQSTVIAGHRNFNLISSQVVCADPRKLESVTTCLVSSSLTLPQPAETMGFFPWSLAIESKAFPSVQPRLGARSVVALPPSSPVRFHATRVGGPTGSVR